MQVWRVPPDWQHPVYTTDDAPDSSLVGKFKPLANIHFEEASRRWKADFSIWEHDTLEFWEKFPTPVRDEHMPLFDKCECTWYQLYNDDQYKIFPITPPFPSVEELVDHFCYESDLNEASNRNILDLFKLTMQRL